MKKIYLSIIGIFMVFTSYAQSKYFTKNGKITFEASVASFEEIKAENNSVTAILNTETNEIAALALMQGFHFEIALMEEHFNENYAESDEYPKATFKGKLEDFNFSKINNSIEDYKINGILKIRGKEKKITASAKISKLKDQIHFSTKFSVKPEEFDIKIPGIVKEKIAKEIEISVNFNLEKK